MDDDFYVEDEPIEDVRAAWQRGERGVTAGPRTLDPEAQAIADEAAARLDAGESRSRVSTIIREHWESATLEIRGGEIRWMERSFQPPDSAEESLSTKR